MSNTITQTKVDVIYQDGDELKALTVALQQRDKVQAEIFAARRGWPAPAQASILALTIAAWSALLRDPMTPPQLKHTTPDPFIETVIDVRPVEDNGEGSYEARPTQAAPLHAPASPSL